MKTFTPIAMRCTQEQFEAIKPKLKGCRIKNLDDFEKMPYLINYHNSEKNSITNYLREDKSVNGMVVYEEWNEGIFLKACGIEVETLQEKEQRLLKELEVVRKEIEENKIKAGDWVWNALNESCYKKTSDLYGVGERKIINPELIKLLEEELINKLN